MRYSGYKTLPNSFLSQLRKRRTINYFTIPQESAEVPKKDASPNNKLEFSSNLTDIMSAIKGGYEIEGVNIRQKIQERDFTFSSNTDQLVSIFSEVLRISINEAKFSNNSKATQNSRISRNQRADVFARNLFKSYKRIMKNEKKPTLQEVISAFHQHEIFSPTGKRWGPSSLQMIYKRWEKLGLKR